MGKEKKSKKRRRSSSSESTSSSSNEKQKLRKLKKKLKKERQKAEKILRKKIRAEKKKLKKRRSKSSSDDADKTPENVAADIPIELMERSKAMAPMTKEEWDKRQSVIRKVLDEESGRYRLIKGDGEVLEEIVTKDRHKEINRLATRADGTFFQTQTMEKKQLKL